MPFAGTLTCWPLTVHIVIVAVFIVRTVTCAPFAKDDGCSLGEQMGLDGIQHIVYAGLGTAETTSKTGVTMYFEDDMVRHIIFRPFHLFQRILQISTP